MHKTSIALRGEQDHVKQALAELQSNIDYDALRVEVTPIDRLIWGLALSLLTDDHGTDEETYGWLRELLSASNEADIINHVKATDGRFYLLDVDADALKVTGTPQEEAAYAAGCPRCGAVQDCTPDCSVQLVRDVSNNTLGAQQFTGWKK
jgi:hypothetical protein